MDKRVEVGADRRRLGCVVAILQPVPDWLTELLIWITPEVLNNKPAAVAVGMLHRITHRDCFLDPRDGSISIFVLASSGPKVSVANSISDFPPFHAFENSLASENEVL